MCFSNIECDVFLNFIYFVFDCQCVNALISWNFIARKLATKIKTLLGTTEIGNSFILMKFSNFRAT